MTDDIVTRLREEAQTFWDVRRFRPLWIEAADEIERLRIMADGLYQELLRGGCWHDVTVTQKWEEYEQGVRGE